MKKNSNLVIGLMSVIQSLFYSWGGEHWPPAPRLGDQGWQFGKKGS